MEPPSTHTFRNICLVFYKEALVKPLNPLGLFFPDDHSEETNSTLIKLLGLDRFQFPPKDLRKYSSLRRKWVSGSSFMPNCQWAATPNPSHLFFATSIALEWSRGRPNVLTGPFERVVLSYCPDPRAFRKPANATGRDSNAAGSGKDNGSSATTVAGESNVDGWDVGMDALQIAFARWADREVGLLPDLDMDKRFPRYRGVVCFEQLLVAFRFGILLAAEDEGRWLSTLASKYPSQSSKLLPDASKAKNELHQRCRTNALRIAVWKRESNSWSPRLAANEEGAVSMIQTYSKVPVSRVTANSSTSTKEHIELFNSFDLLISSSGSQLAGLVFAASKPFRAVLEWGICQRTPFWAMEARKWDMLFEFSHGHAPTDPAALVEFNEPKACVQSKMGVGSLYCRKGFFISKSGFKLDLDRLKVDLERTLGRLCERVT